MHNKIFKNKKILLGVTGCIAAYKAAFLTRDLKILGAEVKVIMTTSELNLFLRLLFQLYQKIRL